VVGGTGFYLRALFDGLFTEPDLDAVRRALLRAALVALPAAEQMRWAQRLDPGFAGGGTQRAQRAIEVALLAGAPLSRLHEDAPPAPAVRPWYALLSLPRDVLVARIARRTAAMLDAGLVAEVRAALESGVPEDAPGLSGVGYPEVIDHLRGRSNASQLAEAITVATRRYAKRQATWFRHQLRGPVMELDASQPAPKLAQELLSGYRAALETGN
jgi:tRNA dimethylallyltransferase